MLHATTKEVADVRVINAEMDALPSLYAACGDFHSRAEKERMQRAFVALQSKLHELQAYLETRQPVLQLPSVKHNSHNSATTNHALNCA